MMLKNTYQNVDHEKLDKIKWYTNSKKVLKMKRRKIKKKKTDKILKEHFKTRWVERVGISAYISTDTINKMIQGKEPSILTFHKKQSNSITQYILEINDKKYIVVYNKNLNTVVTVFEKWENKINKG